MTICGGAKISSRVRRELGVFWSNAVVVAVAVSVAVPSAQKNARPRASAEVGLLRCWLGVLMLGENPLGFKKGAVFC